MGRDEPRRVCVCASVSHPEALDEAVRTLTLAGHLVLAPVPIGRTPTDEEADTLRQLHEARIRLADEVVVVPKPDDTIGASVRAEAEYARSLGKPIRYTPANTKEK